MNLWGEKQKKESAQLYIDIREKIQRIDKIDIQSIIFPYIEIR